MEGISRHLLPLRELLYPDMFGKGGLSSSLCYRRRFWAPFGSFLTGLASYALGTAFWSRGAGLAALMAALLIPDAGLLNIAHPLYNYFWLQHIAPGGLYGVAIAGAALIFIIKGVREGRRIWIVSGVVVGALVALFKVHVFMVAFPLLLSFAILGWPPCRRSRWVVLGMCDSGGNHPSSAGKSFLRRTECALRFLWQRSVLEAIG